MNAADTLNRAFAADPNAVHAILCNRVPCNEALADDPTVIVDKPAVLVDAGWNVGMIGLLNGILVDIGLPKVASKWSDETDDEGRKKLVGFCEVSNPPAP